MSKEEIQSIIQKFIAQEIFSGQIQVDNSTALISSHLIDSITSMQLVAFIEDTFSVHFKAHEISEKYLDNINCITDIVYRKING